MQGTLRVLLFTIGIICLPNLQTNVVRAGVQATLSVPIEHVKPQQALEQAMRRVVAGTVGGLATNANSPKKLLGSLERGAGLSL